MRTRVKSALRGRGRSLVHACGRLLSTHHTPAGKARPNEIREPCGMSAPSIRFDSVGVFHYGAIDDRRLRAYLTPRLSRTSHSLHAPSIGPRSTDATPDMFQSLARLVNTRGWLIIVGWVAVTAILFRLAPTWDSVSKDDDVGFFPSGYPSVIGQALLKRGFPKDVASSQAVVVVERPGGDLGPDDKKYLEALSSRLGRLMLDEPKLGIKQVVDLPLAVPRPSPRQREGPCPRWRPRPVVLDPGLAQRHLRRQADSDRDGPAPGGSRRLRPAARRPQGQHDRLGRRGPRHEPGGELERLEDNLGDDLAGRDHPPDRLSIPPPGPDPAGHDRALGRRLAEDDRLA